MKGYLRDIIEEITVLSQLRDAGLEDLGSSIITGAGLGIGFKAVDFLVSKIRKDKGAGLEEYHTEGLACKICGRPVPPGAIPEVWTGYHIKYDHRDYVKKLAKDRLPWVAGLTVVGEVYPLRKQALQKLKPYTIIYVHDDGDLTIRSGGKEWVVSTEGKAYINHKLTDVVVLGRMQLLTQEIRKRLPPIKSTEFEADPIVQVKFFTPWTYWTWYATEFDGDDLFYGLVRGHEVELGYFSLKELESVKGPYGLYIERDRHFEPIPLSKVREQLEAGKIADTEVSMGDKIIDLDLEDLTPAEKDRQLLLKSALDHVSKATIDMAKAAEFHFNVDEKIADGLRKAWGATEHAYHQISNMIGEIVAKELNFAKTQDRDDKVRAIEDILEKEIYIHRISMDKDSIMARARELAKMTYNDLDQHRRKLFDPRYMLQKTIEKASYQALGRQIPAWLKQNDIEELADEYVLPVMKEYAGDKLSLAEIKKYVDKSGAPAYTDEELAAALDYLEEAGEIMSFDKTEEKPKRWIAFEMEDSGLLLASQEKPKLIEVYKTTIVKHYRPKSAFHKTSFRVLKPNKTTLLWLGCLKTDEWRGKSCSESQTLHKIITKKTDRGMQEVRKLEKEGVTVKYFAEEGIEPRAEDDLMNEIAKALKTPETLGD